MFSCLVLAFIGLLIYISLIKKSRPETTENAKKASTTPLQVSLPDTNNEKSDAPAVPVKKKSYTNEKYGLKIVFPSEISAIEAIEAPAQSLRAYNPVFAIEIGKDKNDFFEADGVKHGNLLSVLILDRKKCESQKLDKNEEEFCNDRKTASETGSWGSYEHDGDEIGLWFGNDKYLFYISDPSFLGKSGLLGKIKVSVSGNH